ncbi:MAG: AIR synthase-related protein, partial [Devosia sp.]
GILPTPTIGGVGIIPDWSRMARAGFAAPGELILLFGAPPEWGTHLGQSIYLRDLFDRREGPPPPVDLAHERRTGDYVRRLIRDGIATAVHDLSDGGLAVALAEMAIASGIGAKVNQLNDVDPVPLFFGEDQGRYLVTIRDIRDILEFTEFMNDIKEAGIFAPWIGTTGGETLQLGEARPIRVTDLRAAHEGWFPRYMAGEL